MTSSFICQSCRKETVADIDQDEALESQVFYCEHCGAKHVAISAARAPGGPVELQFRLVDG